MKKKEKQLNEEQVDESPTANTEYWKAVYEAAARRREREEVGEIGPPYHDWWRPY